LPLLGISHLVLLSPTAAHHPATGQEYNLERIRAVTATAEVVCMELEEGSSPSGRQLSHENTINCWGLLDMISASEVEENLRPEWWIFFDRLFCRVFLDCIPCVSLR